MNSIELVQHKTVYDILRTINTPRSLTVWLLYEAKQFFDLVSLEIQPAHYLEADSFHLDYQATKLLSKNRFLETGVDLKKVALDKFWAVEEDIRQVNEFYSAHLEGRCSSILPDFESIIRSIKSEVRYFMSSVNWLTFLDHVNFGPGADMSTVAGQTAAYDKIASNGTCTREATKFLDFLATHSRLSKHFLWDVSEKRLKVGVAYANKLTVVRKNAKTDRVIAIEPRWNIFLQKGAGKMIRQALLNRSVDLNLNGESRNAELAHKGSIDGSWSTIDLESASDCLSTEVVRLLLPTKLFSILDSLRSKYTLFNGEMYKNEKFSSMGNGFTFELESLIFASVARSVCGDNFSVFGDDIVIPTVHFDEVVRRLRLIGFKVNTKKTFSTGPFRESCGEDFFNGVLVTPIYWTLGLDHEGISRLSHQAVRLTSNLLRVNNRKHLFSKVRYRLGEHLPPQWLRKGPLSNPFSVASHSSEWKARERFGWEGLFVRLLIPIPIKFRYRDLEVAVTSCLLQPSSDGYSRRDRVRLTEKEVFVSRSEIEINDSFFQLRNDSL